MNAKNEILDKGLVNLSVTSKGDLVKISIETPNSQKRNANDIVAVLDISGSMDTVAEVKNKEGIKENHGLTLLDLLKHAVKTVIHSLSDQDRFCLITYSDNARIDFPLSYMTK